MRPVEVPIEPLTPELVEKIEENPRLTAVAAVARRYVATTNGTSEDPADDADD